jgi:ABC-type transporter Mla maintaining outer membrane lipid asymmetry ATPase subunit MlaF
VHAFSLQGLVEQEKQLWQCFLLVSRPSRISGDDIKIEQCKWDESLAVGERCGVLFQQTTLLDQLTVAGNVCVALEACCATS